MAGRNGTGIVDDNCPLCKFIYRNLRTIAQITATMDTPRVFQIPHAILLVDKNREHPKPSFNVNAEDVRTGTWKFNLAFARHYGITAEEGQERLKHYITQLGKKANTH